ncbi:MAG: indole-3-glycerol-phosphate synthase [Nitrososphaerota archaeon]|jgi:indole-3-glycerol phosphate synthase|nr:indole-3-glycerol-phosphate synthase [Nitrososphaerota archaeon]
MDFDLNSKIIIDFKPVSPKYGNLFNGRNPLEVACRLERTHILGLSVVTENEYFGGSLNLLRSIVKKVKLPVLRKDFIKTKDDLHVTLDCGATGVLLICSMTPNIVELHEHALEIGLKPVVEVHTLEEMQLAKDIDAKIIGINNKDITNLEKDAGTVDLTLDLIKTAPKNVFIISESGIDNRIDAQKAIDNGANAVLVGTAFWQGRFHLFDQ